MIVQLLRVIEVLCSALRVGKYFRLDAKINGLNQVLKMMTQPRRTSRNEMLQIQTQIIFPIFCKMSELYDRLTA